MALADAGAVVRFTDYVKGIEENLSPEDRAMLDRLRDHYAWLLYRAA